MMDDADVNTPIPPPPYEYESMYISQLFLLPPKRTEPLLPAPLLPYCFFGLTFFEIMIVKYSKATAVNEPDHNFAYNEVGFGAHCLFRPSGSAVGIHGVHYKLMYLDNELGIETGRRYYGFPKEPAEIRIDEHGRSADRRISVEVVLGDQSVLQAEIQSRARLRDRFLAPLERPVIELQSRNVCAMFPVKSGIGTPRSVTLAPFTVQQKELHFAQTTRLKVATELGFGALDTSETLRPDFVIIWDPFRMRMERPKVVEY